MHIFNIKYKLKNDLERILITNNQGFYDYEFTFYIHPVYAWILNQFDGKREDNETFGIIQTLLGIKKGDLESIISVLFSNPKEVAIQYDGVVSRFPPNVLVRNDENSTREKNDDDFFTLKAKVNHHSNRLFKPSNIVVCPTLRCYTDCIYCYADRNYPHSELSSQAWINFIQEAKQEGIETIDVTGGEFFLKKNWQQIAKALTDNGYFPDVSTKVPLSNKTIDLIKGSGLLSLQVSLDTLNGEIASKTLNVNERYVASIKQMVSYADEIGLKIILKPTFTKYTCTIKNLEEIFEFALSLKNMERLVVSIAGYSCYKPQSQFPEIRASIQQIEVIRKYLKEVDAKNIFYFPIYDDTFFYSATGMRNSDVFDNRARCMANVDGFVVLPDGTVTICEELYWTESFVLGNISNMSISEIWNSKNAIRLATLSREESPLYSSCLNCSTFKQCHQGKGVCWKLILGAYGKDQVFEADPRCPRSKISNVPFTYD